MESPFSLVSPLLPGETTRQPPHYFETSRKVFSNKTSRWLESRPASSSLQIDNPAKPAIKVRVRLERIACRRLRQCGRLYEGIVPLTNGYAW